MAQFTADVKGQARSMTPVLYQKFAFGGGDKVRATQSSQSKTRSETQTAFITMFSSLSNDKTIVPEEVLDSLLSVMEIRHLHPKILAAAQFLLLEHNIRNISTVTREDLERWMVADDVWPKLVKSLPKDPPPSKEAQMTDIFRYMATILNYKK
jgi:hypothetical protein